MLRHLCKFVIIEAGPAQTFIIQLKTKRMNQVQMAAGVGTQAYDIAGIRRNLRLKQNNMKQAQEPFYRCLLPIPA